MNYSFSEHYLMILDKCYTTRTDLLDTYSFIYCKNEKCCLYVSTSVLYDIFWYSIVLFLLFTAGLLTVSPEFASEFIRVEHASDGTLVLPILVYK
jgi:hypothetical protein